jgi:RimJ/RimL family protein N-acetyltransferase
VSDAASSLSSPPARDDRAYELRQWRPGDEATLLAIVSDTAIHRFTTMPHHKTQSGWSRWIADRQDDARAGTALFLAIDTREGPVGSVNLLRCDWSNRKAELGFWMAPEHRRRGIMTSALSDLSRWCFTDHGLLRLELLILPANEPSVGLAARVGYTNEGLLRSFRLYRGQRLDLQCFSLLPEDLAG